MAVARTRSNQSSTYFGFTPSTAEFCSMLSSSVLLKSVGMKESFEDASFEREAVCEQCGLWYELYFRKHFWLDTSSITCQCGCTIASWTCRGSYLAQGIDRPPFKGRALGAA